MTEEATKTCPYCAETIKAAAVVCRFCGKDLVGMQTPPTGTAAKMPADGGKNWQCSACKGYVRADATQCKHCRAAFTEVAQSALPAVAQPKKRPPLAAYILVTLGFLTACAWFFGLFGGRGNVTPVLSPANSTTSYQVVYRVSGTTSSASLTYQNAQGGSEQKEVRLPWQLSLTGRSGQFLYMSAQNSMQSGTVICEIMLNGVSVKTSTSEGAYKIATCSGRI
jgi:hypothetical protein